MMNLIGSYFMPAMVLIIFLVFLALLRIIAKNYIKVPPNKVAVFYGKKQVVDGKAVGFKVVTGGAKFKIPIIEDLEWLDLSMFSIDLKVEGVPNKDGVLVNVRGVANVKILSDETSLMSACERFLGKSVEQIKDIAFKNLEGHLRAIVGQLTVEDIVSDRSKLNQQILAEAGADLGKLGLGVDLLTIQDINDDNNYIKSLGLKRTAQVQKDAAIGKAEAERDSLINTSNAQREGKEKENQNLALIAETTKTKEVKEAAYKAEVATQQATTDQAGPKARQEALKAVVDAEINVELLRQTKNIDVAIKKADLAEKELIATKIKPAEAQKAASIAEAEGKADAVKLIAEGDKQKKTLEGEGDAAAILAKGKAEAETLKVKLLAEAEGLKAKLLAEAEGLEKKADAYKKLDESGKLLQILEAVERILPQSIEKLGPVFAEIAKPFASIDRISVVDIGGGGENSKGGLSKFAGIVPGVAMQFFEQFKALGFDTSKLQDLLKIKTEENIESPKKEKPNAEMQAIFEAIKEAGLTVEDVKDLIANPTLENLQEKMSKKTAQSSKEETKKS